MDDSDNFFYCGTTTGDILKINMSTKLMSNFGPKKEKFSLGITDLKVCRLIRNRNFKNSWFISLKSVCIF